MNPEDYQKLIAQRNSANINGDIILDNYNPHPAIKAPVAV